MRYFLSKSVPSFSRVLVIESGSRGLFEGLLQNLYDHSEAKIDLVTCYAGVPRNFRTDLGTVYRVGDYPGRSLRKSLYKELAANGYNVVAIICSAEPIMTKWKWVLAARLHGKVLIVNENGDYFWLDRGHLGTIRHFILFRAGLTGSGAVRTIARLLLFPFALFYLILYAVTVHLRRKLRTL